MAGPAIVEDATLDAGTKVPISVEIVPSDYGWEVGDPKLVLWGHVTLEYYDPVEDEWISTTPKIFRFSISY